MKINDALLGGDDGQEPPPFSEPHIHKGTKEYYRKLQQMQSGKKMENKKWTCPDPENDPFVPKQTLADNSENDELQPGSIPNTPKKSEAEKLKKRQKGDPTLKKAGSFKDGRRPIHISDGQTPSPSDESDSDSSNMEERGVSEFSASAYDVAHGMTKTGYTQEEMMKLLQRKQGTAEGEPETKLVSKEEDDSTIDPDLAILDETDSSMDEAKTPKLKGVKSGEKIQFT
eukprot:UN34182